MPLSRNRKKSKKRSEHKHSQQQDMKINKSALTSHKEKYTSITINGFRQFESIELPNLGQVNLIFGSNNSGKTTILEAVFTHACGLNQFPFIANVALKRQNGNMFSGLDLGEKILSLFYKRDIAPYHFSISSTIEKQAKPYILKHTFFPSHVLANLDPRSLGQPETSYSKYIFPSSSESFPNDRGIKANQAVQTVFIGKLETELNGIKSKTDVNFPPNFVSVAPFKQGYLQDVLAHREESSDIKIFGQLKRYGILDRFIDELRIVFPYISEIDMIPYPDGKSGQIYVITTSAKRLPLYAFGDGLRRWYNLIGNMLVYSNSVHCIEEIDATFHPDAQKNLSILLIRYAKEFNNQIFITSHSIEFADAFLGALYGKKGIIKNTEEDPARIFTLKFSKDNLQTDVWPMLGKEAYENRQKYELELR